MSKRASNHTQPSARGAAPNNSVFLRGRLAADAVVRQLPSGDDLCIFRLTVDRPPGQRARVDSLDCSTTRAGVRSVVQRGVPGDELEVTGALHRRFWRGAGGLASRYEVDVNSARISSRQRSAASPGRKRASA